MLQSECETGKRIFGDPQSAEREAKRIRRRNSERMHPYKCNLCHRYHLTHAEGRDKPVRQRRDDYEMGAWVA